MTAIILILQLNALHMQNTTKTGFLINELADIEIKRTDKKIYKAN
jgi:hypothetical protein